MIQNIYLANLTNSQGSSISGVNEGDQTGRDVSLAGDMNGDGKNDFILSAYGADSYRGIVYILYGKDNFNNIDLSTLDVSQGFSITGVDIGDECGSSVSEIGDFNNDGYGDVIIAAEYANFGKGNAYIIFGGQEHINNNIDLSVISENENQGITVYFDNDPNNHGDITVSGAGDVNNDGIKDVIISVGNVAYVLYGKASPVSVSLSQLTVEEGFLLTGFSTTASISSCSGANDVNGDGYDDLLIGAKNDGTNGMAYVIYGSKNITSIDVTNISTAQGIFIAGNDSDEGFGRAVSGAGDVNKDGFMDVIASSSSTSTYNGDYSGISYIVYGGSRLENIYLSQLNSTTGITIIGANSYDKSGRSVSRAGDFNKDGYDDVIIGADEASGNKGISYVIFGGDKLDNIDLAKITNSDGITITGADNDDYSGYSVDGDGDVFVGAYGVNGGTGAGYIIYGQTLDYSDLDV